MDSTCLLMNKRNVLFASIRNFFGVWYFFRLRRVQEKTIMHYSKYNTWKPSRSTVSPQRSLSSWCEMRWDADIQVCVCGGCHHDIISCDWPKSTSCVFSCRKWWVHVMTLTLTLQGDDDKQWVLEDTRWSIHWVKVTNRGDSKVTVVRGYQQIEVEVVWPQELIQKNRRIDCCHSW